MADSSINTVHDTAVVPRLTKENIVNHQDFKMEAQRLNEAVASILKGVHSIQDFTSAHLRDIMYLEQTVEITQFAVSPIEFSEWISRKHDNFQGVEYDATKRHLIVRGISILRAAASVTFRRWLSEIEKDFERASGSRFFSGTNSFDLHGAHEKCFKEPDGIVFRDNIRAPYIVLEVGVGEATRNVFEDAEKWLAGTRDQTKLVILVDIQETGRRQTSEDTWDLTPSQVKSCTDMKLYEHLVRWYRDKEIRLVGNSFTVRVHLWTRNQAPRCVLDTSFSPAQPASAQELPDAIIRISDVLPDISPEIDAEITLPLAKLVTRWRACMPRTQKDRCRNVARQAKNRYANQAPTE